MTIRGKHYRTGQPVSVEIKNKRIVSIAPLNTNENLPFVGPGLCDLQLNGYGGLDFNGETAPSEEKLLQMVGLYQKEGCTSFLPTLITNAVQAIKERILAFERLRSNPILAAPILGYHIEGPFISPHDGPRGAHPSVYVRKPELEPIEDWHRASGGRLKILTLSPEWENSCEIITKVCALGVVLSIGHTAATAEQITSAVWSGASMVTHFGNGASVELRRHPNFMWQQLAEDGLALGLIPDGFHLPDAVLKTAVSVKKEKFFLVSDSTAFGGMKAGSYESLIGGKVVLSPEGRLSLAENPALLAGSAQSLRHGVEHMVNAQILPLGEAWHHASCVPASLVGAPELASLRCGALANTALFRHEAGRLIIEAVYQEGAPVYKQ